MSAALKKNKEVSEALRGDPVSELLDEVIGELEQALERARSLARKRIALIEKEQMPDAQQTPPATDSE